MKITNSLLKIDMIDNSGLEEKLSSVKMTDYALNKAQAYAKTVCEISGAPIECGGFLLGVFDKFDGVATDTMLLPGQDVSQVTYMGNSDSVSAVTNTIASEGKKIIGWWHSHDIMQPFHSSTDDINMRETFKSLSVYNKFELGRVEQEIASAGFKVEQKNGVITITSNDVPAKVFMIKTGLEGIIPDFSVERLLEDKFIGATFAYSVVVNAIGSKPYCEVYFQKPGLSSNDMDEVNIVKNAALQILESGLEVDEQRVREDCLNLVSYKGVKIGLLGRKTKNLKPVISDNSDIKIEKSTEGAPIPFGEPIQYDSIKIADEEKSGQEIKPEVTPESKPEPKPEIKLELKQELKLEPRIEPLPQPKIEQIGVVTGHYNQNQAASQQWYDKQTKQTQAQSQAQSYSPVLGTELQKKPENVIDNIVMENEKTINNTVSISRERDKFEKQITAIDKTLSNYYLKVKKSMNYPDLMNDKEAELILSDMPRLEREYRNIIQKSPNICDDIRKEASNSLEYIKQIYLMMDEIGQSKIEIADKIFNSKTAQINQTEERSFLEKALDLILLRFSEDSIGDDIIAYKERVKNIYFLPKSKGN